MKIGDDDGTMKIFAHSNGGDLTKWQTLQDHCKAVAAMSAAFAVSFASGEYGRILGIIHDLGKARTSFQSYLRRCNGMEDSDADYGDHSHSGAGACWLWSHAESLGKALAYCVAGHHAGLPDWSGGETPNGALVVRLAEEASVLDDVSVSEWISVHESDYIKEQLRIPFKFSSNDSSLSFWIRMVYSCLVDADFLDTESFMEPERAALRPHAGSLAELAKLFFTKLDEKQCSAADTPVNRIRAEIRSACEQSADLPPGLFSLTVPTGGGKTLSGTAFAFKHALRHGLKRIIYVIPYTSIIEQTADLLRGFLGTDNVLEHHSNFDPEKETPQSRLASENWDAPVVVTTAVQFFESRYACKSSRCRKLHNIAESVVILDEVQLLPTRLLLPCAEAIRQLALHYRTSFVLSTATQLNLPGIDTLSVREMVPQSLDLYHRLKRTNIEFPVDLTIRHTWGDIADELKSYKQALCIVNTRRDCYDLFTKMPEGTIHLSASMCGEHRSHVIADIKRKLAEGDTLRVVSTQLVEAGVDIDFPVVYRAFAGLSSVAQSAGRCNREGRLDGFGRVVVFMPPEPAKIKDLRDGEYAMSDLLERPCGLDVDDACSYPDYFKRLHSKANDLGVAFEQYLGVPVSKEFRNGPSRRPVAPDNKSLPPYQFREAATAFKMIDGAAQVAIIVRYGNNDSLIDSLRAVGPKRDIMRRLQRYTVNVPRSYLPGLLEKGMIEEVRVPQHREEASGIYVQTMPSAYREDVGFDLFGEGLQFEDFIA